jgi:light-regulated signal transduction histidine kinase (bacteriophytochrome)
LRRIEGFIQILSEDYSAKLDEKGRDYIHRILAGSRRMQNLTDALLGLSKFAQGNLDRTVVHLGAVAKKVAGELTQSAPERRVEFTIGDDMRAEGDPDMLRIVIENLIENAWKFTAKQPIAKIEFGVKKIADKDAYFVRDNGVGFSMVNADRMFNPFQRLHSEKEFPGLGIGLATAQRIIQRHGGRIWAEGEPDKGAIFFFTLD